MRRRLLRISLMVGMICGLLAGCGSKGADLNEMIEDVQNEIARENIRNNDQIPVNQEDIP